MVLFKKTVELDFPGVNLPALNIALQYALQEKTFVKSHKVRNRPEGLHVKVRFQVADEWRGSIGGLSASIIATPGQSLKVRARIDPAYADEFKNLILGELKYLPSEVKERTDANLDNLGPHWLFAGELRRTALIWAIPSMLFMLMAVVGIPVGLEEVQGASIAILGVAIAVYGYLLYSFRKFLVSDWTDMIGRNNKTYRIISMIIFVAYIAGTGVGIGVQDIAPIIVGGVLGILQFPLLLRVPLNDATTFYLQGNNISFPALTVVKRSGDIWQAGFLARKRYEIPIEAFASIDFEKENKTYSTSSQTTYTSGGYRRTITRWEKFNLVWIVLTLKNNSIIRFPMRVASKIHMPVAMMPKDYQIEKLQTWLHTKASG